jgi:hypothetical protein
MTEDKMPILWEHIRGARAVGEKWERKSGTGNVVATDGRSSWLRRRKEES